MINIAGIQDVTARTYNFDGYGNHYNWLIISYEGGNCEYKNTDDVYTVVDFRIGP